MLQIQKQAKINFDNQPLEISPNQLGDFLLGAVSEQVTLGEGVTLNDIMNVTFHLKDFIYQYFIEQYEGLNSIVTSGVMLEPITKIIVYKELIISPEGETIIVPQIRTSNNGSNRAGYYEVDVEIDNVLQVRDESGTINRESNLTTHITLLEFLGAIFEEFQDYITRSAGTH